LIWHIWWLLALGFLGAWATLVVFAWRDRDEKEVSAAELRKADAVRRRAVEGAS
jgi:cytochrome o ubiquinol oxidase subunit 1